MAWLRRVQKGVQVNLAGFQEGLVSVAERVNSRVQRTKLFLEVSELQKTLNAEYARIGRRVHELNRLDRTEIEADPEFHSIFSEVASIKKRLRESEHLAIDSVQREIGNILLDFQQALKASEKVVQRWEIESLSRCVGKELTEITFPEGCFLLCLVRQGKVFAPTERAQLVPGDLLLVVGPLFGLRKLKERTIA